MEEEEVKDTSMENEEEKDGQWKRDITGGGMDMWPILAKVSSHTVWLDVIKEFYCSRKVRLTKPQHLESWQGPTWVTQPHLVWISTYFLPLVEL